MLKYVNWVVLFGIPFVLDRIFKHLVMVSILQTQPITSFFNICITFNRGIARGVGSELSVLYNLLLTLFIGLVLIYFALFMHGMQHSKTITMACMLILSGGISNFIDRVWYGSVIDFLQLHYQSWYFPVFNIADVSITIGAILLLYGILQDYKKQS